MLAQIARVLVVVGAINWGLIGLGMLLGSGNNWNVISLVFGSIVWLEAIIYVLVGLAAVWTLMPRR